MNKYRSMLRDEFQRRADMLGVFERFSITLVGKEEKRHRLGLARPGAETSKSDPIEVTPNLVRWIRPTPAEVVAH
jgi:hypothetical protein